LFCELDAGPHAAAAAAAAVAPLQTHLLRASWAARACGAAPVAPAPAPQTTAGAMRRQQQRSRERGLCSWPGCWAWHAQGWATSHPPPGWSSSGAPPPQVGGHVPTAMPAAQHSACFIRVPRNTQRVSLGCRATLSVCFIRALHHAGCHVSDLACCTCRGTRQSGPLRRRTAHKKTPPHIMHHRPFGLVSAFVVCAPSVIIPYRLNVPHQMCGTPQTWR